jgi:hypothetical protein
MITDIQNLNIIDDLQGMEYGEYFAGEEPEDSSSHGGEEEDEDGEFDEDEEGEEESEDDNGKQRLEISNRRINVKK